jgi:hypothetical protein
MWKLWRENQGRRRKNNDTVFIGAEFDEGYVSSNIIPITIVLPTYTNYQKHTTY